MLVVVGITQIQVQVAKRNPKKSGMATSKVGVNISMIISNSKSKNRGYNFVCYFSVLKANKKYL